MSSLTLQEWLVICMLLCYLAMPQRARRHEIGKMWEWYGVGIVFLSAGWVVSLWHG